MTNHRQDAVYATLCSHLGLSARDVAEIGGFSDRFARDLLAGRKSFPRDTKRAIFQLYENFKLVVKEMKKAASQGNDVLIIYRTNEQLRASPMAEIWAPIGEAKGGFVGPYRAAMFEVFRWAGEETLKPVQLVFAEPSETN